MDVPSTSPARSTFAIVGDVRSICTRSFTLDDPAEEIGQFLAEAGFVHIEGMFTEAEMAAVSAELDDAVADAERDDGASWWARTDDG